MVAAMETIDDVVRYLEDAITANRRAFSEAIRNDTLTPDYCQTLNDAYFDLMTEHHRVTGIDPAPYRMGR